MTYNIAHRGYSSKYPENTLLAFKKAIEVPCDGIELDLQLTKDGHVVIVHDEELGRTVPGTGFIKDYTLAELKEKNAGYLFSDRYGHQEIPTLEEYFDLIQTSEIFSVLEMKNAVIPSLGLEENVIRIIADYDMDTRVTLSSFNQDSIRITQFLAPHLNTALLSDTWFLRSYKRAKKEKVDFLNLRYHYVQASWLYLFFTFKIPVMVWTVNSKRLLRKLVKRKVYAIITNEPERLHELLKYNKKPGVPS